MFEVEEEEDVMVREGTGFGHEVKYVRDDSRSEFYGIYRTEIRREAPIFIDVQACNRRMKMELDTGASITVAGKKELKRALGGLPILEKSGVKLKTFSGRVIEPLGVVQLQVSYRDQKKSLPVVVTSEPGPILMGRNWLRELDLDWRAIMA